MIKINKYQEKTMDRYEDIEHRLFTLAICMPKAVKYKVLLKTIKGK